MVFVNIPYVPENNRIGRDLTKKEIEALDISDGAKQNAYAAVYNKRPRGVNFESNDSVEAIMLEDLLYKLGIPYRRSEVSEYQFSDKPDQ
jgi:hypothetical protein